MNNETKPDWLAEASASGLTERQLRLEEYVSSGEDLVAALEVLRASVRKAIEDAEDDDEWI